MMETVRSVSSLLHIVSFLYAIKDTTRQRRDGELDGVDYHFVSLEEFVRAKTLNEFFESGNRDDIFYGTKWYK